MGEVNNDLQLANVEQEIYWNGRYWINWSSKELYIIDPRANKIYSNKALDLPFVVSGEFYSKADSLVYFSPSGKTILKYAIKTILEESDEIGPLYTSDISLTGYMGLGLGVLLLGGLGTYIKVRRSKRKRSSFFTEQEENLLKAFMQTGGLSTQDINEVLGSATKSLDNQRRIRSIAIKQINQKLHKAYGIKEGIEKQADTEDKRITIYTLQEGLAEKLAKDGGLA